MKMLIDSEDLKKYVNYICVKDHDVMTKKAIMQIIKLVEEDEEHAKRIHEQHPELFHEDGEL
jgi:hypothetical protein